MDAASRPADAQEALILQSVDRFIERDVRPVARSLEAADTYPAAIVDKLVALGVFGATIAPEHGGLGLSAVTYARMVERMSAAWMSVAGLFNSHLIMAQAVQRYGTPDQQRRFLPRFAAESCAAELRSPSPTAAPTSRPFALARAATAITTW